MVATVKSQESVLRSRNLIKMPTAVLEELGLSMIKGSKMLVWWGKNYQCVVITPIDAKLGDKTKERIHNLTNEPLDTSH